MKPEQLFKKNVKNNLRNSNLGIHVIDMSNIGNEPGCPDLHISKDNVFLLAELKSVSTLYSDKKMRDLFTDAQPAFYTKYLENNDNLFLIIEDRDENLFSLCQMSFYILYEIFENNFTVRQYNFFALNTGISVRGFGEIKNLPAAMHKILAGINNESA